MTRLAATQVLSFPGVSPVPGDFAADAAGQRDDRVPGRAATETIESLRARCRAAEDAAGAAAAAESRARAELLRVRQTCQEMLEAAALEVLELKRALEARGRTALDRPAAGRQSPAVPHAAHARPDEIAFDQIEAVLAASPL